MSKCEALSPLRMMALGRDPGQAMVPRKQRLLQSQTAGLVELFDACVENDVKKAAYYIKYGVDLEGMNQDEDRPMHVAVMNDNFHVVECLLLHGANVYGLDVLGRKPMHLACLRGNLRLVHLLFKHGNGITDHKLTDDELRQPLHYAAQANDNDICELLIDKGAEVEAIDSEGRAPLHFAALSPLGDWEVAACLVARGADVHFVDKQGIKALHLAATRIDANAFAFIEYLLSQGCDIDERTANGRTPLFFAAVSADVKMVKFLLEKGADINAKTHQRIPGTTTILHQTALHYAAIEGTQVAIVQFLLDKGAESGEYLRTGAFCLYLGGTKIDEFTLPFESAPPTRPGSASSATGAEGGPPSAEKRPAGRLTAASAADPPP